MNKDEFESALKELESIDALKKKELCKRYADANKQANVGDIVCDHIGCIKVEDYVLSMGLRSLSGYYYIGRELKKGLTPRKDGRSRTVHYANIIKVLPNDN